MQARVAVAHVLHLQLLNGLDHGAGEQIHAVRDARKILEHVDQQRAGGAQQLAGFAGDQPAVFQLDGAGRSAGGLGLIEGGLHHGAVLHRNAELVHEQLDAVYHGGLAQAQLGGAGGFVITADDLLLGGGAHGFVVHDAEARHIHAHIGGGAVNGLARDLGEHGVEHREDLHVAVVVDGGLAVGLEVEGVDHVHVVQVGGGGFIGDVYRVLEGQVPYGEGLELGVTGAVAPLILVVELRKAGGHFAAAGAGGGHHHKAALGFDEIVFAVAVVRYDQGEVRGVFGDDVVAVYLHAEALEPLLEHDRRVLLGKVGDAYAANVQAEIAEGVDQAEAVHVVGDAQIPAALVFLDIVGADHDHDLGVAAQLVEHADL